MLSETQASAGGFLSSFLDPSALVVVLAGTMLATIARCGGTEIRYAALGLIKLGKRGFDEDANRAALARSVSQIAKRGHLCAETSTPPDPATARLVDAYVVSGSLDLLHSTARAERAQREIARAQAVRVFEFAGELAPVFGLVGTLFSITQLTPAGAGSAAEMTMAAVGTAVLSSLYGVLTANLVCIPLARVIERRSEREEEVRAKLFEWFDRELTGGSTRAITAVKDAA